VFFDKTLQFLTQLKKLFSQKIKVLILEEVIEGSPNHLLVNQSQNITAPSYVGPMKL
jgi:hypothetical protein